MILSFKTSNIIIYFYLFIYLFVLHCWCDILRFNRLNNVSSFWCFLFVFLFRWDNIFVISVTLIHTIIMQIAGNKTAKKISWTASIGPRSVFVKKFFNDGKRWKVLPLKGGTLSPLVIWGKFAWLNGQWTIYQQADDANVWTIFLFSFPV